MTQFYSKTYLHKLLLKRLSLIFCSFFLLCSFAVVQAQTKDNPYATKYGITTHWTNSLPWANVHSVLIYGAIANDNQDDLSAIQNAINTLSASGGGVLFFPSGTYNFSNDLIMKTGVILRGETPIITDAKNDGFSPTSHLVFPKYEPTFSGNGTDNSTAFKAIHNEEGASNIGLVYLDVNRAALKLAVPLGTKTGFSTPQPLSEMKNVLIFGVRNNNVATPEPNFPKSYQNQWQRWSYRFGVNIEMFVTENGTVCNNRINDFTNNTTFPIDDDSYGQPGFIAGGSLTGSNLQQPTGAKAGGFTTLTNGEWAKFSYTNHYGIEVNRGKSYQTYGTAAVEPSLYAKGIEVIDNWVYTTRRIGITASGDGLIINGNVKKDLNGKRNYLSLTGDQLNTNNSATLENRGIDWSGTNVTVTYNDIEVYQDALMYSGIYSVDGEGILIQECCGGSVVNGINISNNKITGTRAAYIGIYKMRDSKNIIIRNNIFNVGSGFASVYVQADINNNPEYRLENVLIEGNIGAKSITVKGSGGGSNVVIKNNSGSGNLSYSCYAVVENNSGFVEQLCTAAALPKISAFSPLAAPSGSYVTITGSNFALVNEVFFSGPNGDILAPNFTVTSSNGSALDNIVVQVPVGVVTGSIKVKVPGVSTGLPNPAVSKDEFLVGNVLTISTSGYQLSPAKVTGYDHIVITNGGEGILTANIAGIGKTWVQSGGSIDFKNFTLAGSIFQADSASLMSIGSTAGITTTGNTGNVITSTRRYNSNANYKYTGNEAQVTGNGLPGTVGSLMVANTAATAPDVTLTNNITVNRDVTLTKGNLKNNIANISIKGNWINNSSLTAFVQGNGTFTFNESGANQQIAGSFVTTFAKLIINKSSGDVILITPATVTSLFNLTKGDLVLGNNNLTLTSTAIISGGNLNSYIQADAGGKVIQQYTAIGANITFPLGDATAYTPLSHILVSGTLNSASIAYAVNATAHPQKKGSLDYLSRYFTLTPSGITNANQNISFTYAQTDVNGKEEAFFPYLYAGSIWSKPGGNVEVVGNVVSFLSVTAFGDFTAGQGLGQPGEPTSISFAAATVFENAVSGTVAGKLGSTSYHPNATFTYSLVSGNGSNDNNFFTISGTEIRTAVSLDFEQKAVYSVRIRSTTQNNFSLDKELTISINDVNEQPTLNDVSDQAICHTTTPQQVSLSGISAGPEANQATVISVSTHNNALFDILEATQATNGNALLNYRISKGSVGSANVTVLVKDNGGSLNGGVDMIAKTFTITVNALPVIAISSDKGTILSKGETAILTARSNGTYQWSSASGIISGQNMANLTVRPAKTTNFTVKVTNANGCITQQEITLTVNDNYALVIGTNIISPNGDGINDRFVIKNIDMYPGNEVKIYDRAGRLLYSQRNYADQWNGTLNGKALAEDTYYYIVDFGSGISPIKGFITIIRD